MNAKRVPVKIAAKIIAAMAEDMRKAHDPKPEPEDPTGPFDLYVCPKCRRVFGHPSNDEAPEECGAESQARSTRGVIGTFTRYCHGVPQRYMSSES